MPKSIALIHLHITQDRNSSLNHSNNLRQTSSRETDHQNPPATREELEDGSQPYTPIDHAEVSEGERVTGDYQHSANLEVLAQAEQGDESCDDEPSFVQPVSKSAPCQQQKRKHNFEDCVPESISFDGVDVADDELGNRGPDCLGHLECQATRIPSPSSEPSSADVKGGGDRFMKLSASLRAKVYMIGNTATLVTIEDYRIANRCLLLSLPHQSESLVCGYLLIGHPSRVPPSRTVA